MNCAQGSEIVKICYDSGDLILGAVGIFVLFLAGIAIGKGRR